MAKKVVVLGCGMIGATMARDLAYEGRFDVVALDVDERHLAMLDGLRGCCTGRADLSDVAALKRAVAEADVVVGAMPSRFGFQTLRAVIEAGKPFADISFMPEDALQLDALARKRGVTAVVDCGVAPGLANLLIGRSASLMQRVDRVAFYVGGLPKARQWPYQYKAPFAPSDVVEEYTRPVRLREGGKLVVKPALSEPELMDFPGVGTLEAFNTDGLRSLVTTIDAPTMVEKTLRYPGHIELMRVLRETGFFSKEPLTVGDQQVRPLEVTSKLLFPMWKPGPGEAEFTILRVVVEGEPRDAGASSAALLPGARDGRSNGRIRHVYDLYDETDAATGTSSMARTTGFPCAIVARMLATGDLHHPGVRPPELIAPLPGVCDHILTELARRGVSVRTNEVALTDDGRASATPATPV
ncbi:MAG: saccharopine dehydrogenase NADP-binding domain-containing protein [Phycisphaerales bacterium]|nr:saccharopine dehydrogenase NADP-binding domain-containing protein [Phycisphaerales bacterium]